ncbi:MAG: hypothetical protein GY820_39550 [Gammaproteobacteria bacterium]|nr:hypothetical protein [Gammaproteobacteria bacterium]
MPETDPINEAEADLDLSEFDGMELEEDPSPVEPEVEPAPPEEGTVEDPAEEAQEVEEGTEPSSPPATESVPDFSTIPDEYQEAAKREAQRLSDKRVADLQRQWEPKLEAAKSAEDFNERWEKDPQAVMEWFKARLPQESKEPDAPPDPGPMPNPIDDPDGNAQWWEARLAQQQHENDQKLAAVKQEAMQQVQPAIEMAKESAVLKQRREIQTMLEVDATDFSEIEAEAAKVAGDPAASWSLIKEVHALRKEKQGRAKAEREASEEARRGAEEKPGLSRTGARKLRHQPTGDVRRDVSAEIEEEFPDLPKDLSNLSR